MNPLMQSINKFSAFSNGNNSQNPFASLGNIAKMLRSNNPEQIAKNLMQQNPQFRAFVQANQGKSPEQVARENGIDLAEIMRKI